MVKTGMFYYSSKFSVSFNGLKSFKKKKKGEKQEENQERAKAISQRKAWSYAWLLRLQLQ